MTDHHVNQIAVHKARQMIDSNQSVRDSDRGTTQPDSDAGNRQIDEIERDGFSEWHLGLAADANVETKDRFGLPHGDSRRVHRSSLIHAKKRADRHGFDAIEAAAHDPSAKLDEKDAGAA